MYSSVIYGRRVLIFVFAIADFVLQIWQGGNFAATALVILAQLAAVFFGGAPGSLIWLISSRVPSELSNIRTWNSAMHWQIVVTVGCQLLLGQYLASNFLGLSGTLLLLCYFGAKQGCYRLGCCGWAQASKSFLILRNHIELQKLEALLALALGSITLFASLNATSQSQYSIYLVAVASHLAAREIFSRVRARGGIQML